MFVISSICLILLITIAVKIGVFSELTSCVWIESILSVINNSYFSGVLCSIIAVIVIYFFQVQYSKRMLKKDVRCNEIIQDVYDGIEKYCNISNTIPERTSKNEEKDYSKRQIADGLMYYKFYKEYEVDFEVMAYSLSCENNDILIESLQSCFFLNLNFKLLNIVNNIKNRLPNIRNGYPEIKEICENYELNNDENMLKSIENRFPHYLINLRFMATYWQELLDYLNYDPRSFRIEKLVVCKRYVTAVNIIGHSECEAVINAECIYKLMKLAGTEESIGVETLDDYAVQKIIGWFQQQEEIDLELRSDIEFIYLPMLDEYSEVRPCALNTRLSLEPEYFCSLIELFYKERNGEKREIELNKSLSDRLYEILFQFKVIPGIDWNGNFDAKRFDYWMKTVKTWSRDNDRYEVAMHTVGSGLSYAELDEDKLPQTAVIEELNRVENEELRRGYYLGIINQRGVHWIDPEGKPELELAEDYENRANIAESRGYSRYAGILRVIGDEFKREARRNALRARNENDDIE